jgi:hypothetical protein
MNNMFYLMEKLKLLVWEIIITNQVRLIFDKKMLNLCFF